MYILKNNKATDLFCWDLLDETEMKVVDQIVEDEDQGPSNKWGPYGEWRHLTLADIEKAS